MDRLLVCAVERQPGCNCYTLHSRVGTCACVFDTLSHASLASRSIASPSHGMHVQCSWQTFTDLKISVWLKSPAMLAEILERVAKTAYLASDKDPFAAMLPYMLLGPSKLGTLRNLFRLSAGHQRVYAFLQNDFTEDRYVSSPLHGHVNVLLCT